MTVARMSCPISRCCSEVLGHKKTDLLQVGFVSSLELPGKLPSTQGLTFLAEFTQCSNLSYQDCQL
jgi:hypothetical protein